jgi:hypothetical protein
MDLGKIVIGAVKKTAQTKKQVNIIEFIEADWGLGTTVKLYPVQRVILKAYYGIPLDNTQKNVWVTDWRRKNEKWLTEVEYLQHLYDEGRSNISHVVSGKELRELILSVGRRSGKCVDKDTLVLTSKGAIRIGDMGTLEPETHVPYVTTVAQQGGRRSQSAYFYYGGWRDDCFQVKTDSGYQITGTSNHRVKVLNPSTLEIEWRHCENIKKGDLLAIDTKAELFSENPINIRKMISRKCLDIQFPDTLDANLARFVGQSSGSDLKGSSSRVSVVANSVNLSIVKDTFDECFGRHVYHKEGFRHVVGIHSVYVRRLLTSLGLKHNGDFNQGIPWAILRSPRGIQAQFIRGFFETAYRKEMSFSGGVIVRSLSRTMVEDLQIILANFGVVSSLFMEKVSKTLRYHYLKVKDKESLSKLVEIFDASTWIANEVFIAQQEAESYRTPVTIEHVKAYGKILMASAKAQAITAKAIEAGKNLTYEVLGQLVAIGDKLGLDHPLHATISDFYRAGYFYSPVYRSKPISSEVYDLNVPEGESFIANAVCNHNTFISSCIAAYETYRLIQKEDPQKYYGMPAGSPMQLISVATDRNQAGKLYQDVSAHFSNSVYFKPYTANNTMSYARFQTPADIEKFGSYADNQSAKASVKITFSPCKAKALRGFANIAVIFDEMAHFGSDGKQSSADEIYNAALPSTSTFTKKDSAGRPIGPVESKLISISSPLGRQGQFYKLFQDGFKGDSNSSEMLCIQAPTWEVNPTIPSAEFERNYLKDPNVFFTEYGAMFSDRTRGWISRPEDLHSVIIPNLRPASMGLNNQVYFAGFDLGLSGDGSAIAIGHVSHSDPSGPKIVLDLVDYIKAGEGKHKDQERLEFDEVADWVYAYSKKFRIVEGIFDQHVGIPFEQALQKRGLRTFRKENFKPQLTSDIFQTFKDLMWAQKLQLYNHPLEDNQEFCDYLQELLELQANVRSKNVITVEAPKISGKHDDRADAIVRMVWLASKQMTSHKLVSGFSSFGDVSAGRSLRPYLGGSDPKRQAVRRKYR